MLASIRGRTRTGLAATATAVLAVVASVAAGAVASPASAGPTAESVAQGRLPSAPVVPLDLTPAGFVLPGPNPRPAGPVTFRVSTQDERGHFWSTFKLLNGATLNQAVEWFAKAESPDKSIAFPALRALYTNVEFTGGAAVNPSGPVGLTMTLTPGTYYVTDYLVPDFITAADTSPSDVAALSQVGSVVRSHAHRSRFAAASAAAAEPVRSPFGVLEVVAPFQPALPPAFQAVLLIEDLTGAAVFRPIGRFRASGAFLFHNGTQQPQEVVFEQVAPGTTDRDVQNWYDFIFFGGEPAPNPFTVVKPRGTLLLSPGHTVIVEINIEPGLYCGLSFVTNWNTAVKQAYEGVHVVIPLR
jgi:hypothetical protein